MATAIAASAINRQVRIVRIIVRLRRRLVGLGAGIDLPQFCPVKLPLPTVRGHPELRRHLEAVYA